VGRSCFWDAKRNRPRCSGGGDICAGNSLKGVEAGWEPDVGRPPALTEYRFEDTIATVEVGIDHFPDNSQYVTGKPVLRLDIPVERQAGREERCAQGSLDSNLDRSPKSFGIS